MKLKLSPDDGCFALLDDAHSGRDRASRLYTRPLARIALSCGGRADDFFSALEGELAAGRHVVGLFDYEFGALLEGLPVREGANTELATALVFDACERLSAVNVDAWLAAHGSASAHGVSQVEPALDEAGFAAAVDAIHRYIKSGDTYQVNFTFPLRFDAHGSPVALYAALRARQPVPYGALIGLPDARMVLSLSPELFVSHEGGHLRCRPMKGTAPASGDPVVDEQRARALRSSVKERSENLMIVDLLRNDLGRIARTGSVKVPALFSVDRFGEVLQMTSSIEAMARPGLSLSQVFDALYPCGSITGAPKRRTMQIIDELERWPRGLYTGGIGWFDPPVDERALGDFMLSVPIRTLLLGAPDGNQRRHAAMGVGAGIVHDGNARAEYRECLLKARFLTGLSPGFELFETLLGSRDGCRYLERHLARLRSSAAHFGFPFDDAHARVAIRSACEQVPAGQAARMRLALRASGEITLQLAPLQPLADGPVRLLLSDRAMPSDDPMLAHKTSIRLAYDEGWRRAEAAGAFDMLFFNDRDELTEGGRSNVFLRKEGRWLTPPLSSGLLPGVMRAVLLEDPAWDAQECVLTRQDLLDAEAICVCNALRGVMTAQLDVQV